MMMNKDIAQSDDLARKTNRKWEELPSLVWNIFFLEYFFVLCFFFFCPCVYQTSVLLPFFSNRWFQCNASWNDRSLGGGCVTTSVCVCVYYVCVCLRPVVMETCCGVSAPAAGGVVPCCIVGNFFESISLAGVHGLHVGGAGVPLDGVEDGRQLLIGGDLGLELWHQRRLLGLGDRQQRHHGSHRWPLQLVLLFKLLLHRICFHLHNRHSHSVILSLLQFPVSECDLFLWWAYQSDSSPTSFIISSCELPLYKK